jgi:hypothetical protein
MGLLIWMICMIWRRWKIWWTGSVGKNERVILVGIEGKYSTWLQQSNNAWVRGCVSFESGLRYMIRLGQWDIVSWRRVMLGWGGDYGSAWIILNYYKMK